MNQLTKAKFQAMATSYLRAAVASVLALYMAGQTDPKALSSVFIASLAGPALKALDKSAKDYGRKA